VLLIVINLAAWLVTGSVAMLSTLIDSALDATASFVNLIAVRHAARPADEEHRFGHGKAEPLAGIGQTLFIGASGMFLLFEAVPRLFQPQPVAQAEVGIAVMLISIGLTFALVQFQRHVVRRTGSLAISADSLHYTGDLLLNASVILSLLLAKYLGWDILDPIFAIGIAIYVLYTATKIAKISLDVLMDRELPDAERALIEEICLRHPDVLAVHELRTRSAGLTKFVQLHLELDGELPLYQAHAIAAAVAADIRTALPEAEVFIHQDPVPAK
jgi:ferrous-iron efflux pump FieF